MSIKWDATDAEQAMILKIVDRAIENAIAGGMDLKKLPRKTGLTMDLEACHCNNVKLDLEAMLKAGAGDLGHDVFGIYRFLDRRTGKLTEGFSPRLAKREVHHG